MGSGLKYGEFEFPADRGFTGSAGKSNVKGYMRGGSVKGRNKPNTKSKRAKGTTKAAMGGSIGDAPGQQKMGFQGGDRQIQVDGVGITVPRAKGGRAKPKSTHDKLMAHGKKMGYKTGGAVKTRRSIGNDPSDIGRKKYDPSPKDKNTSARFKGKRGKMDSMDHGVQPARRGANARSQQDRESGGTGRLRPGLKKGGRVKKGTAVAVGALAGAAAAGLGRVAGSTTRRATRKKNPDHSKGKGMSRKGMPKTVKARGGPVGKGGARQTMPPMVKKRGGRVSKKC